MKNIITIITLTIMLFAYNIVFVEARTSLLTGETYEILTDNLASTTILSVPDFPSWQDCEDKKVTLNCNHQDTWRIEGRKIWQDCKESQES